MPILHVTAEEDPKPKPGATGRRRKEDAMSTMRSPERTEELARAAGKLLADSYTLYLKTHNYHWNVVGPMFQSLHLLFETHYNELALAVDEIAERIRSIGHPAPGSYTEFAALTSLEEARSNTAATEMIRILAEDHRKVAEAAREMIEAAEAVGDHVSVDLGVRRMEIHEKTAWMLQSHLD